MNRPLPCFMPEAALEESAREAERRRRAAIDALTAKLDSPMPAAPNETLADVGKPYPGAGRR